MPQAFAQADVVVCRSGMGTVSELAAAGKPSILVPLPTASDQHQLRNAEALAAAGAARLVPDHEMNGARLVKEVMELSSAPGLLEKMSEAAHAFAKPGSAKRAADLSNLFDEHAQNGARRGTVPDRFGGARRALCALRQHAIDSRPKSRNNTVLKCFSNPSPSTSSASEASA